MNYGLATIVNANGSMADLTDDAVWMLPDEFDDQALIHALETLWRDRDRRHQMGTNARSVILENHDPAHCAEQYQAAIENFYTKNKGELKNLLGAIGTMTAATTPDGELVTLASSIATTFPPPRAHGEPCWSTFQGLCNKMPKLKSGVRCAVHCDAGCLTRRPAGG